MITLESIREQIGAVTIAGGDIEAYGRTDAVMEIIEPTIKAIVEGALTDALHPEFGSEWREPDGIIYQAVQSSIAERENRVEKI